MRILLILALLLLATTSAQANDGDTLTQKSLRNIQRVKVLASGQLNTYDVLACDHVVFTQAALAEFVARTGGELVTVDKPAAKPARAAKPKAAAEDAEEPAAKPARAAKPKAAAQDAEEPAAKSAKPKAAADDSDDAEEPAAKPAKAPASRARKTATASATESADDSGADAAPPGVEQRSSGTAGKSASSGSGAAQKEEEE